MDPRFQRLHLMIGPEKAARLGRAHVAVVGLGAVGSYAVEALARGGVGRLRLVDFDRVQRSNINRQLFALESTLGQPKAEVAARRVADINPACAVEPLRLFAHRESLDLVLGGGIDLLVDAIDAVIPKVELTAGALARGVPLVSCMGAALRTDPSAVRVGPLSKAVQCPLASRVRKLLRRRGFPVDHPCVFSVEPVDRSIPLPPETEDPDTAPPGVRRGRERRVLGSLPTLTGLMGLLAAHTAMRLLLGGSFAREPALPEGRTP